MSEHYRIIGPPHGEPRSEGDVGARVRVPLSGRPSRRWTLDLGARLTTELAAHPGVAHLRMNVNELVQADEIVLDGIEDREPQALADALRHAVDAANHAGADQVNRTPNVSEHEAEAIASHIPLNQSSDAATTGPVDQPPCPCCGQPVSATSGDREAGDQLSLGEADCPSCGARLVRDIDGHTDHGWRPAD
jgi:hypothetical protein